MKQIARALTKADFTAVAALLAANRLDPSDLSPADLTNFIGIEQDGNLVAVGALSPVASFGLLRSLATLDSARGNGYANAIVRALEARAQKDGLTRIYLLTETASAFFARLGYQDEPREQVPTLIKATAQFSSLCPDSADVMSKSVTR